MTALFVVGIGGVVVLSIGFADKPVAAKIILLDVLSGCTFTTVSECFAVAPTVFDILFTLLPLLVDDLLRGGCVRAFFAGTLD